ncbi:TetR family transcriptional regulator [Aeromicrobium sp. 636]|uniref:TetR/AcrR family transcriptional regulator n=1 Tax=Aeromicrobium senzhongii TaxID=2663859 RepID=A0A8I0EWG1_9ACTN|nr:MULTISPECIES: TetR/AcrR family transcriptional regulator [Aeromicrobium]MBC9226586.1 TetR/AcrR family transcriptional regulator [Aeromicrobium senzhongii]MCQ3998687.1 TetR family transcriptional regulator [Aeromicrobium sp. 636]MTB89116.1 TetR family transcriptional regulator [Aeromicrobium senzhongii]QNL93616.1 TetR/AcrR family transcriptional regulator [Aeromicrobium senzhongii]
MAGSERGDAPSRDDGLLSLLPERMALPRGRSALPKSVVEESRRGRIMQATLDEVADCGYAGTTVARITRRAHVSRTSFYETFTDKEDAFAAAHWNATDLSLTRIWKPTLRLRDLHFHDRIRRLVRGYVEVLEAEPTFAICFFVEIKTAGERLATQREQMLDRHVEIMHELAKVSARDGSLRVPSRDVLRGLVGAFDELVSRAVRRQRGREEGLDLSSAVEPFTELLLGVVRAD